MVPQNNTLIKYLLAILLCSIVGGCTSSLDPTKPNEQFHGSYTDSFKEIKKSNALLAKEIGKLPDIQDGISSDEMIALKRLDRIYNENPIHFDEYFDIMYQIGLPEVRKYCTPLQAFFWLLQKNPELAYQRIKEKEINWLLSSAWFLYYDKSRWGNPQDVMDRLNAPIVFELWLRRNFKYNWKKLPVRNPMSALQSAKQTLKIKKGVCMDAAYLAYICLGKAGYETIPLRAYFYKKSSQSPLGYFVSHTVCVIKKGNEFYMAGDTNAMEMTKRPFSDLKEIAEYIAEFQGCSLKGYVTGYDAFYRLKF